MLGIKTLGMPIMYLYDEGVCLVLASIDAHGDRKHVVAVKLDLEANFQPDSLIIVPCPCAELVPDIEDPNVGTSQSVFDDARVNLHWVLALMTNLVNLDRPTAEPDEHSLREYVEYALALHMKLGAIKPDELRRMLLEFCLESETSNGIVLAPTKDFRQRLDNANTLEEIEALTIEYLGMLAPGYHLYANLLD